MTGRLAWMRAPLAFIGLALAVSPLSGLTRPDAMTPSCSTVLSNGIDSQTQESFDETDGGKHYMWSLLDFKSGDITKGKWVGAIQVRPVSDKPSKLLRGLRTGDTVCVRFKVNLGPKRTAQAWFAPRSDVQTFFRYAAYCDFTAPLPARREHAEHTHPRSQTDPGHCTYGNRITLSVRTGNRTKSVTIPFPRDGNFTTAIEPSALKGTGLLKAEYDALIKAFTAAEAGPWFPCDAFGCCRVFGKA